MKNTADFHMLVVTVNQFFNNIFNLSIHISFHFTSMRVCVTSTDPAVEGAQASEWAQGGSGGRGLSRERTQPAGAAGPGETTGQDGAAVQLEQAATAAQPSPLCR